MKLYLWLPESLYYRRILLHHNDWLRNDSLRELVQAPNQDKNFGNYLDFFGLTENW